MAWTPILQVKKKEWTPTGKKLEIIDIPLLKGEPGSDIIQSDRSIDEVFRTHPCIKCGSKEAPELGRCGPCEAEHERLCADLDSRPKSVVEQPKKEWIVRKEVKQGVIVTTYMRKDEAQSIGIKVD